MKPLPLALVLLLAACDGGNGNPASPSPTLGTPIASSPTTAPTPAAPAPTPVGATPETFTGSISGGSPVFPTCGAAALTSTFLEDKPCSTVSVVPNTSGTLTASLTWRGGNSDLDLYLFRGDDRLASSVGVGAEEEIRSRVSEGMTYQLVVSYYRGSRVEDFMLRVAMSGVRTVNSEPAHQ